MNKKLIAVAVASTLAAPVVYADITPYGRVNNAIDIKDDGDGNTIDLSGVASRFGFKGSGDIGNGLTAIGRYEFATTTDKEQSNVADLRLGYVGLSGGFGTVTMGNQWSAYFNSVGTFLSPTYSLGYILYSSITGGPFRTSNTVKYNNTFGPVTLEADVRLNESGEDNDVAEKLNGDGYGIGATFALGESFTIAAAFDLEENNDNVSDTGFITPTEDTERAAIVGNGQFGNVGVSLGYQTLDDGSSFDTSLLQLYVNLGVGEKSSFLFGYGQADVEANNTEPSSFFLGYYYNMGGGLKLYFEGTSVDFDEGAEDYQQALLGMRIDF